jgi:nicotinamide N-methyltransferase
VWNAGRFLADAIDDGELCVEGCAVLELGAGAGLPSLTASLAGAAAVVATDYGTEKDDALVAALRANAAALAAARPADAPHAWCDVHACAHVWGTDVAPLLARIAHLSGTAATTAAAESGAEGGGGGRFDRIILADLLFNRQSHALLLATCAVRTLASGRERGGAHTRTQNLCAFTAIDLTC